MSSQKINKMHLREVKILKVDLLDILVKNGLEESEEVFRRGRQSNRDDYERASSNDPLTTSSRPRCA